MMMGIKGHIPNQVCIMYIPPRDLKSPQKLNATKNGTEP